MDQEQRFFTRWKALPLDSKGRLFSFQEIQISGFPDQMENQFSIFNLTDQDFQIELKNETLGRVIGKGKINPRLIGWEFRIDHLGFEGFEFYEKSDCPSTYLMHAEYATQDEFRTSIHGKIWHAQEQEP